MLKYLRMVQALVEAGMKPEKAARLVGYAYGIDSDTLLECYNYGDSL